MLPKTYEPAIERVFALQFTCLNKFFRTGDA
nr:MAG TPA_asm: hypothetical protein [Caudoviricetes sp.]